MWLTSTSWPVTRHGTNLKIGEKKMSNTEFKDLVICILNKGWMHNNKPIDTAKFEKRLDDAKYLARFKQRIENKAERYCISEHDAIYSVFRNTNILTK